MGDLYLGAKLAVLGSIISVILSVVFLKDYNKNEDEEDNKEKMRQRSFLQSMHQTLSYLRHPTLGPLLFIKLLNGVSSSAFTTVQPLVFVNKLHLDTSQLGFFMSASSLSVAAFASFGISSSMSFVGDRSDRLASLGILFRIISMVIFGVVVSWCLNNFVDLDATSGSHSVEIPTIVLCLATISSITISISSHMHATSLTTLLTGSVSVEHRGAILGLEHGLFSLARVVGPPLGTTLLSRPNVMDEIYTDNNGRTGIWRLICAGVMMDSILLVCLRRWSDKHDAKIKSDECIGLAKVGNDAYSDHDHSD